MTSFLNLLAVKQPSETGSMQKQVFGDDKSETKMLVMPREKRHMSIYMSVSEPKLVDREASFTESEKKGRESIVKMKRLLPGSISSGQSLRVWFYIIILKPRFIIQSH